MVVKSEITQGKKQPQINFKNILPNLEQELAFQI